MMAPIAITGQGISRRKGERRDDQEQRGNGQCGVGEAHDDRVRNVGRPTGGGT